MEGGDVLRWHSVSPSLLPEIAGSGWAFCSGDRKPSGNLGEAPEKRRETLPVEQGATFRLYRASGKFGPRHNTADFDLVSFCSVLTWIWCPNWYILYKKKIWISEFFKYDPWQYCTYIPLRKTWGSWAVLNPLPTRSLSSALLELGGPY